VASGSFESSTISHNARERMASGRLRDSELSDFEGWNSMIRLMIC
jgi:hypothetical protein